MSKDALYRVVRLRYVLIFRAVASAVACSPSPSQSCCRLVAAICVLMPVCCVQGKCCYMRTRRVMLEGEQAVGLGSKLEDALRLGLGEGVPGEADVWSQSARPVQQEHEGAPLGALLAGQPAHPANLGAPLHGSACDVAPPDVGQSGCMSPAQPLTWS